MNDKLSGWMGDQDRGVSPVIGVILMVAITVILAAVIGNFVLGLGSQLNDNGPTVSLGATDASDAVVNDGTSTDDILFSINHNSGQSIEFENIKITVEDPATGNQLVVFDGSTIASGKNTGGDATPQLLLNGTPVESSNSFSAGDKLIIRENGADALTVGNQYRITITHTESGSSLLQTVVELR